MGWRFRDGRRKSADFFDLKCRVLRPKVPYFLREKTLVFAPFCPKKRGFQPFIPLLSMPPFPPPGNPLLPSVAVPDAGDVVRI